MNDITRTPRNPAAAAEATRDDANAGRDEPALLPPVDVVEDSNGSTATSTPAVVASCCGVPLITIFRGPVLVVTRACLAKLATATPSRLLAVIPPVIAGSLAFAISNRKVA